MNQKNEITPQSNITEQRTEIEWELRLAKKYWLRTVQPRIAGRILRGVEFFVAQDAHRRLQVAIKKADDWNRQCVAVAGEPFPPPMLVSVDVDLSAEEFREPEEPKMLFAENVKPEILAAIAAPLVNKGKKPMTPGEAIRRAHELLMDVERYIGTLPRKGGTNSSDRDFDLAFGPVTFAEILQSNEKDSGQLPLLPPSQQKRNEGHLTLTRLKAEVKRFLQNQISPMTQDEYEQAEQQDEMLFSSGRHIEDGQPADYDEWQQHNQAVIDDCLKNSRIAVQDLCTLRWERFKKFWLGQQNRALTREANKSAATTPPAVRKRGK